MRQALLTLLWLVLLSFPVVDGKSLAGDRPASAVHDPVFDRELSDALQQALEEARLAQGSESLSAGLYISERCQWQGATGVTAQDASTAVDPDTLFAFGSITKTFVAAVVLQLVEENRLALHDRLGKWLKKHPRIDPNITVRQLLNHSSGLGGYMKNKIFRSAVLRDPDRIWSPKEVLTYIASPSAAPGAGTLYTNTNYILLGLIIEAVTGNPVERELEDRIFGPLRLESTFLRKGDVAPRRWANSKAPPRSVYSTVWIAGAVVSTPRDIARWGHALFSGGVLKPASLQRVLKFEDRYLGQFRVPMGLGVWDLSLGDTVAWGHGGRLRPFLARMLYLPDLKLSVAYASSGGRGPGIPGQHLGRAFKAHRPDDMSMCFEAAD